MTDNPLPGEESSYTFRLDPDGLVAVKDGFGVMSDAPKIGSPGQVGLVEVGIQSQGFVKVTYPPPPLPGLQSGHTPFIVCLHVKDCGCNNQVSPACLQSGHTPFIEIDLVDQKF